MQSREIQALVNATVKECTKLFKDNGWADRSWGVDVRMSFSSHRNRSWGGMRRGRPFISLALLRYVGRVNADFIEYKSFNRDREIGSVMGDTTTAIRALVMHEMCHAIQYTGTNQMAASVGATGFGDRSGHGNLWKNLYRATRNALLGQPAKIEPTYITTPVVTTNTIQRGEALRLIRRWITAGVTKRNIINCLVCDYGFKKTTATTYTYSIKF